VRIAAFVTVAAAMLLAWRCGLLDRFSEPARLAHDLAGSGARGYAAFILAYTVLQPFGVPGTVFIVAAALIWPWPVAFALSMIGTMAASVVGFSFARFVAREWVATLIPARFRAYDEALARRGFVTVLTLRFVFWMPPLLHAFFGVSRVGFWTHFWGSLVGYVIPLLAVSYFGPKLFDLMRSASLGEWAVAIALLGLGIAVGWALVKRAAFGRRAPGADLTREPPGPP
jgi:uncharacterized membrane protein YdjX (TVP38/TMEM64 family)